MKQVNARACKNEHDGQLNEVHVCIFELYEFYTDNKHKFEIRANTDNMYKISASQDNPISFHERSVQVDTRTC
jgi:hypothetical protein